MNQLAVLDKCFFCKSDNPTILKPVPIYVETFFKSLAYKWVCKKCNKQWCEHIGYTT